MVGIFCTRSHCFWDINVSDFGPENICQGHRTTYTMVPFSDKLETFICRVPTLENHEKSCNSNSLMKGHEKSWNTISVMKSNGKVMEFHGKVMELKWLQAVWFHTGVHFFQIKTLMFTKLIICMQKIDGYSRVGTLYLMAIVMFALSATFYEKFENQIKLPKVKPWKNVKVKNKDIIQSISLPFYLCQCLPSWLSVFWLPAILSAYLFVRNAGRPTYSQKQSICLPHSPSPCPPICIFVFEKLFTCLSACLPVYLSVCLSDCLSVHLSVYSSVCLSSCLVSVSQSIYSFVLYIYLSVCLSVCVSACLSVCLSLLVFLSVCLSVCLFVCVRLFVCLSVCLPVCLSVCLSVGRLVCLSGCLSVCLSLFLSVYLSVCLSKYLPVWFVFFLSASLSVCQYDRLSF